MLCAGKSADLSSGSLNLLYRGHIGGSPTDLQEPVGRQDNDDVRGTRFVWITPYSTYLENQGITMLVLQGSEFDGLS